MQQDLTRAETGTTGSIANRLLLIQEDWFDAWRFKALPSIPEWSDFDDCHRRVRSLYVHLIIMQSSNDQLLPQTTCPKSKRHNAKLCPFAIRQRIINALANGDSIRAIARALHVSNNTVTAIAEQEWQQVAARKERIAAQCELNATLAAERMTDKLRGSADIPLNTLVPAFGVSVDKLAILRGHVPGVNIANIWMPSEAEREERRAMHDKLDAIATQFHGL